MEQNQNSFTPEAPAYESASPFQPTGRDEGGYPVFASREAEMLYWRAYMDGVRASGREPGHPHMPADFSLDLVRDGASPSLTSAKLLDPWPEAVQLPGGGSVATGYGGALPPPSASASASAAAGGRAVRHDGWTGERQRLFLDALAQTGVVADACRAVGMSRDGAYDLRKRAEGAAFAIAWDAAILTARRNIADDVMGRARHGVVDRVYRNGELVAERHRYDNRLTMAVLTRLDRLAEGFGEGAGPARIVAGEWDQFLDIVQAGGDGAGDFLSARANPPRNDEAGRGSFAPAEDSAAVESTASLLARLAAYRKYEAGLAHEISTDDLDPSAMDEWTEEQWARADFSGFLDRLPPDAWPADVRGAGETGADGMCRSRRLYLDRHPEPRHVPRWEVEDEYAGCDVWKEDEGRWVTDFPPTADFDGWQEGEPGEEDYRRELSQEEAEAMCVDEASVEAERRELLAEQAAARDRFFGFSDDDDAVAEDAAEPAPAFEAEAPTARDDEPAQR